MHLGERDQALLEGEHGEAASMAMRLLVRLARAQGSERFLDIESAHIDSCLYHGRAGLDFALALRDRDGAVSVPTSLNVSSLDLLHPDLYRGDAATAEAARRLMDAYVEMRCRPTWTCAPYQAPDRPALGSHVAWAESNAIVFANSVLGARTNRYGDFVDICAAITGRVPAWGLHLDQKRRGDLLFEVDGVDATLLASDAVFPVLGHVIGEVAGARVPVITGIEEASEDQMKALGAAAASSGSVGLFHIIGITPEAPDLSAVFPDGAPEPISVGAERLRQARDQLTTAKADGLDAVSVGTPHASGEEVRELVELLQGRRVAEGVSFYLSTGRDTLASVPSQAAVLAESGVQIVTDTCTYITPILDPSARVVMTNSAKWAFYAPGNLGVDVLFGSTADCVESAVAGRVRRDERLWGA